MGKEKLNNNQYFCENWSENSSFCLKIDEKIHEEKSKFQHIEFFKNKEFGTFFALDGAMMVNEKDEFMYHDMITHPAFAVNPKIEKVLILGGGDGGTAREVARYKNVKVIDMVEIDERVVRLCQKYLPLTASQLEKDKRINLYFEDGVEFVKNAENSIYDLVLIDSTDPISIGEGLFTTEFYKNVKRILKPEGILINQAESTFYDQYAINAKKSQDKLKNIFKNVMPYSFQMIEYPSGTWMFSFSSDFFHPINDLKIKQWNDCKLKTKYYNTSNHVGSFYLPNYSLEKLK